MRRRRMFEQQWQEEAMANVNERLAGEAKDTKKKEKSEGKQ